MLRADDPWWDQHYPPNDWGCTCKVHALSQRDMDRAGKKGPDKAPDDGTRDWTDKRTGITYPDIPNGVGPGFAYTPGKQYHYREAGRAWAEKLQGLDPDIGAAMADVVRAVALPAVTLDFHAWVDELKAGGTPESGSQRVIGALTPDLVAQLQDQGVNVSTAAIVVRDAQVRQMLGAGVLSEDTIRHLPRLLAGPRAVLSKTKESSLVFVFDAPARAKKEHLVVHVDVDQVDQAEQLEEAGATKKRRPNFIRPAGLASSRELSNQKAYTLLTGEL